MPLQAGICIKSTALLNETVFENTLILLTECNEKGALGFVVNKPFHRRLNELVEFRHSPGFPLYDGGPVDREHLFFIHRCPDLIDGGTPVGEAWYGGNFQQAVAAINNGSLTSNDLKIFIGYCGWDTGELEAELDEGSWEVVATAAVFQ